jgi:hypothetical protein
MPPGRITIMPETGITLDPDQADDLRDLLTLTAILQEWLAGAADHILDDLAHRAYRDTFHPRSYAAWLTEDLAGTCGRLRKALSRPQPARTKISYQHRQGNRRPYAKIGRSPSAMALTHQLP